MDRSNFTIHTLTTDDLYMVRDIALQTWPISYKGMISNEQIIYMLNEMYNDDALRYQREVELAEFFIISSASEKVGFASCGPSQKPVIYKLHKLYVLPHIQKSGAGSELLNHCINFSRLNGANEMFLQVNRRNAAVAFYRRHGFSIDREEKFDIGSGFVMDDYIMKIAISAPDASQF